MMNHCTEFYGAVPRGEDADEFIDRSSERRVRREEFKLIMNFQSLRGLGQWSIGLEDQIDKKRRGGFQIVFELESPRMT